MPAPFLWYYRMKNSVREDALYLELNPLIEQLHLLLVDAFQQEQHASVQVRIVITTPGHSATIDDCARVHKLVEPRISVLHPGGKDVNLEVSTPGLQRSFKDFHEFHLFTGKRVRVLCEGSDDWISAIIEKSELRRVWLRTDSEMIVREDIDIRKAKLEFRWEEKQ